MIEFRIDEDSAGMRLDKFLRKRLPNVPVSHLFKMVRTKKVRVNGKRAQPEQPLALGDTLSIWGDEKKLTLATRPDERPAPPPPPVDPSELRILLEDDWIMAVDKPCGMAVHTGSGITGGTLVDYVRAHLGPKAVRNDFAASPAHRLDRETSGVILVAKRRPAMVHFTDLFTHGHPLKRYLTLVKGKMPRPSGVIDLPLAEHQQTGESKARRGVNMQHAVTRWKVVEQSSEAALPLLHHRDRAHASDKKAPDGCWSPRRRRQEVRRLCLQPGRAGALGSQAALPARRVHRVSPPRAPPQGARRGGPAARASGCLEARRAGVPEQA